VVAGNSRYQCQYRSHSRYRMLCSIFKKFRRISNNFGKETTTTKMASLLDDEVLVSAPPLTDEDHNLEIQELVVDDLHVVDMLAGHSDVVNEVTVLESSCDRPDSLDLPTAQELVVDNTYMFDDAVSSAEPEFELCTDYASTGISHGAGRKTKVGGKMKKQGGKAASRMGGSAGDPVTAEVVPRTVRKWERKQVQIKTLEGEFTVTVWATGSNVIIV